MIFHCRKCYISNPGTLYSQPGTHVFVAEEKTFFKGPFFTDYYLEFRVIRGIPVCFTTPYLIFNQSDVISGLKIPLSLDCINQISACTYKNGILLMSRYSVGPVHISLPRNILRAPTIGGRVFDFPRKIRGKKFSCRIVPSPVNVCPVSFVTRCRNIHSNLDSTERRRVTLPRIFLRHFAECMNFSLPFIHPFFEPGIF